MNTHELTNRWIGHHNENYSKYLFNQKEPRWHTKAFFLYSYYLLRRLGVDNTWDEYIEKYKDLFRRDPANDYYGHRSPINQPKARDNSLEWANAFEIVGLVGFPYNESAGKKMLRNAHDYLLEAMRSPGEYYHDLMLCSAVQHLPTEFGRLRDPLFDWVSDCIDNSNPTVHQLIAYLNAAKTYSAQRNLRQRLSRKLISWMESPSGTHRAQVLIWSRLSTRLEWAPQFSGSHVMKLLSHNLFGCLDHIQSVEWHNTPIILEAVYKLSRSNGKRVIQGEVASQITPSRFFKFKEVFDFIDEELELRGVQSDAERVKEKCQPNPTKELCRKCMDVPQGECWTRVLAKTTGVAPGIHGPFEISDVVVYALEKGIYFVIKSKPIARQRGEGDILYRQCIELFSTNHALVLYWNPHDTAPSVIERIRGVAASMATSPRFEVVDRKYIRQVYDRYRDLEDRSNRSQ